MRDGVRLAARMWLPEDAEEIRCPAILEYIPYRKDDARRRPTTRATAISPATATRCVRVDMRGSGDSEGMLLDEYLPQEQDDAEA